MQMVSHMRSPDAQKEWQHNLDFHPELLHKVKAEKYNCAIYMKFTAHMIFQLLSVCARHLVLIFTSSPRVTDLSSL